MEKRFQDDGYPAPIFKPKRDHTDKKQPTLIHRGYTPLQAADLWAFELFQSYKQHQEGKDFKDFRWAAKQLDKLPGEPGIYTEKDLKRLSDMLSQKRQGNTIIQDPATGAYLFPRYNRHE